MATVEAATATVVAATVTVVAANYPNGSHSRSNRCQGCMQSIRGQGHLRREAVGVSHVSSTVGPRDDGLGFRCSTSMRWCGRPACKQLSCVQQNNQRRRRRATHRHRTSRPRP
jgi:hypothetical protein